MENPAPKIAKDLRDDKSQEQMEKSLGLTGTTDEKYQTLLKKCFESEKDNKKLLTTLKLQEKRYESLLREKENLQKEHNKNVLMRTKLEQVCREQQKLLKSVQNESMKHKETQAKFQHSINEISLTLNKNNEENIKLKEDNIEMTKKLKYLAEQYQIREKQLEKINEQVLLENQLHEAKLAKAQMESTMEKEILLKEKQCALDELLKCKKSIQELQNREEALKEQLSLYTSKYDDFQSSLQKSNDVFATYKTELEKMVKKTKKLEKESLEWKRKCERSAANLLDLATQNQSKDEYINKTAKQMQQLQKLLRTLQAERSILYKSLKENNIETPPMPILPPEPEPVPIPQPISAKQPDKIESMAKSCAELKQSLALLQNQMSALTTKQTAHEQQTSEVAPKSKSRKNKAKNKNCPIKDRNETPAGNDLKVDDANDPPSMPSIENQQSCKEINCNSTEAKDDPNDPPSMPSIENQQSCKETNCNSTEAKEELSETQNASSVDPICIIPGENNCKEIQSEIELTEPSVLNGEKLSIDSQDPPASEQCANFEQPAEKEIQNEILTLEVNSLIDSNSTLKIHDNVESI